jgi:hypothetical protein
VKSARPPQAHRSEVPLDTLGKLADRSCHLFGDCLICRKSFDVALDLLIRTRGRDCEIVGMKPLKCSGCQGFHTEICILPPKSSRGRPMARSSNDRGGNK